MQLGLIKKLSGYINDLSEDVAGIIEARRVANQMENIGERAGAYHKTVFSHMSTIREIADELEMVVDDELWPLPKYREMLFFR